MKKISITSKEQEYLERLIITRNGARISENVNLTSKGCKIFGDLKPSELVGYNNIWKT